jgi:hypothetical protein
MDLETGAEVTARNPRRTHMVRAKFECTRNEAGNIALNAVHSGSKENLEFFRHTPNGQLILSVVNESAARQFIVGKQYYVDFTEASGPEISAPAIEASV